MEPTTTRGPAKKRSFFRLALGTHRGFKKLDRAGGGGFGLSTIVKLAGWSGMIAVLAVLFVKLRHIQAELDPVANGVEKLQGELNKARSALREESTKSKVEINALADEAHHLREKVVQGEKEDARTNDAVVSADEQANALTKSLQDTETALQTGETTLEKGLSDLNAAVGDGKSKLQAIGPAADAVTTQATQAGAKISQQEKELTTTLTKVEQDASALSEALEKATRDAKQLDEVIAQRIQKAKVPPAPVTIQAAGKAPEDTSGSN